MLDNMKKEKAMLVAAGAVAAVGVNKILKSKMFKDLTVRTVASGLQFKDEVENQISTIKESAEDVVAEAKVEAGLDSEFAENIEDDE